VKLPNLEPQKVRERVIKKESEREIKKVRERADNKINGQRRVAQLVYIIKEFVQPKMSLNSR
jgi:hypothetical protein